MPNLKHNTLFVLTALLVMGLVLAAAWSAGVRLVARGCTFNLTRLMGKTQAAIEIHYKEARTFPPPENGRLEVVSLTIEGLKTDAGGHVLDSFGRTFVRLKDMTCE